MDGGTPRARAKRSLGQNFLIDSNIQRKIVAALDPGPFDEVVEIGPGRGALTRHLEGAVRRLVLVELDDALAEALSDEYLGRRDVEVVHGDILAVPFREKLEKPGETKVVGNIPYNITTPIIFRLLERPRPADIVLMVQDEVADRIVAPVGSKAYGALSIGVRSIASAKKLFKVRRRAFRPVPGVDSAILRITPTRPEPLTVEHEEALRRIVRASFQWRRKQLRKILRSHPDLGFDPDRIEAVAAAVGVNLDDRPERLSPEDFVELTGRLNSV